MRVWLPLLLLGFCLRADTLRAQAVSASDGWQTIHSQQPKGVQVELSLPKTHFAMGERIDATLRFSNSTDNPYTVEVGASLVAAKFHAQGPGSHSAVDPLAWYYKWNGMRGEGPVCVYPLPRLRLTLPVNESLSFNKPGVYTLYAQSSLGRDGPAVESARTLIVSQKVQLTIDPLTPEKEQEIIRQARQEIALGGDFARQAVSDLGYLRTPAGYAEMMPLLAQEPQIYNVAFLFLASPHPADEAAAILDQVKQGKLIVPYDGVDLYARLKTSTFYFELATEKLSSSQSIRLFDKIRLADAAARAEILDAQLAPTRDGKPRIEALWAAFEVVAITKNPHGKDDDGGRARSDLAARQLELPQKDIDHLIDLFSYWGSPDFLPLLRQQAAPPFNNPQAQNALAHLQSP